MTFTLSYRTPTGGGSTTIIVEYTANGTELGTGFTVPIGTTLGSVNYHVAFYSTPDDAVVPLAWSFPNAGRTTTQFEVRFAGDALTNGATYKFQIVEA